MASRGRRTAKSVFFSAFGGIEVLDLVEVERPRPAPGEVVVEVLAAGINHIEGYIREGRFEAEVPTSFPQGQGSDFAGLVVEVGEGVTAFAVRSEVLGHAVLASHANYVVVPARNLVAKPQGLSWEVAGSLFLAGLTAYDAVQAARVGEGDTVVISAAAGGVGSIELQLAKARGALVIGTCGERNFDYLRQLGVKPVVYGDGIADRIRAVAPRGVTAFLDNYGGNEAVAEELEVQPARFRSSDSRKDFELRAVRGFDSADDAARQTGILGTLATLAAERKVDLLISGFYPLERVQDAFTDLEKYHARGKVVLGMRTIGGGNPSTLKARDVHDSRP
ncbi:NADP-dependent oxidoreductase [Planctomonas psychrotolerans]|uniref:NADP-dependent oxidoreductase n=1 Tax=Planctomonas psychrotolerans TaxID=2528712 RepID=UPI00123A0628|nr:NADP-dependent oxidoreductase [Planctomonas psychrotolerans]